MHILPGRPVGKPDQMSPIRAAVPFNRLKQWRGIAMRSDKLARNYRAGISLATTLIWIKTEVISLPSGW